MDLNLQLSERISDRGQTGPAVAADILLRVRRACKCAILNRYDSAIIVDWPQRARRDAGDADRRTDSTQSGPDARRAQRKTSTRRGGCPFPTRYWLRSPGCFFIASSTLRRQHNTDGSKPADSRTDSRNPRCSAARIRRVRAGKGSGRRDKVPQPAAPLPAG